FVRVWDVANGQTVHDLKGPKTWISGLAYGHAGKWIAACAYDDKTIHLWDADTGAALEPLEFTLGQPESIALDREGKRLACQGSDGGVVWDVQTREVLHTWQAPAGNGKACAFSADGKWLAACCESGIKVWDAQTYEGERTLPSSACGYL